MKRLWQNEETGIISWAIEQPTPQYIQVPTMFEDDLPEMTDAEYTIWFASSAVIGGVRMGPKI